MDLTPEVSWNCHFDVRNSCWRPDPVQEEGGNPFPLQCFPAEIPPPTTEAAAFLCKVTVGAKIILKGNKIQVLQRASLLCLHSFLKKIHSTLWDLHLLCSCAATLSKIRNLEAQPTVWFRVVFNKPNSRIPLPKESGKLSFGVGR